MMAIVLEQFMSFDIFHPFIHFHLPCEVRDMEAKGETKVSRMSLLCSAFLFDAVSICVQTTTYRNDAEGCCFLGKLALINTR